MKYLPLLLFLQGCTLALSETEIKDNKAPVTDTQSVKQDPENTTSVEATVPFHWF